MNGTVKRRWTARDEAALIELQQRKTSIMEDNIAPVRALASAMLHLDEDQMVQHLTRNADAIRDALEPFDSGARPAS